MPPFGWKGWWSYVSSVWRPATLIFLKHHLEELPWFFSPLKTLKLGFIQGFQTTQPILAYKACMKSSRTSSKRLLHFIKGKKKKGPFQKLQKKSPNKWKKNPQKDLDPFQNLRFWSHQVEVSTNSLKPCTSVFPSWNSGELPVFFYPPWN